MRKIKYQSIWQTHHRSGKKVLDKLRNFVRFLMAVRKQSITQSKICLSRVRMCSASFFTLRIIKDCFRQPLENFKIPHPNQEPFFTTRWFNQLFHHIEVTTYCIEGLSIIIYLGPSFCIIFSNSIYHFPGC